MSKRRFPDERQIALPLDGLPEGYAPLPIVDDRTPEQLKADGDDRWPDGTKYVPPLPPVIAEPYPQDLADFLKYDVEFVKPPYEIGGTPTHARPTEAEIEAAYEATEAAIQQVDDGATEFDRARVQKGLDGVLAEATPNVPRFTSDDIWYWMEDHGIAPPREPRLLGAIIRKYVADGKIRDSGMFHKSTRRHCAPLRLWERIF